jgi:NAD(P)-dependent dehydrogenase (short-subunit alcohol dehydrogenase family)
MTPPSEPDGIGAGRVVLVTGGTAGIGRGAAEAFAAAGLRVVIAARDEARGKQVVADIRADGGEVTFVATDVTDGASVQHAVTSAVETYGRLDHAFNNAGIAHGGSIADLTEDDYDATFAVNARGLWLCLKHEIAVMRAQGGGSIVNNTSVHGFRTVFPGVAAYIASKHTAVALTRIAAVEEAAYGIRVNGVAPGPIDTEMLAESERTVGGATTWKALIPVGRVGRVEEVASVALWLFSDAASYVNGQVVAVDGGFLAS